MSAADPAADPPQLAQLVPRVALKPDRKLPIIILGSLLLHVMILLPLLLPKETALPQPQEIPVELVREPPAPKPPPPKQEAPKPKPKPPEQKPPEQAKTKDEKKPEEKKPDPPKKPEEKKPAEKQSESTSERMNKLLGEDTPSIDPAVALPGAGANGTETTSYARLVLSQVAKAKKEGRSAGVPGKAVVTFSLTDTGEVASVSIKTPSGDPALDAEAIAMVKRGAPYPPPPPGARRDFAIGLQFRALP